MDAIFVRDGDTFQPTPRAGSPWGEGLLHGGPPAGLMARAIEQLTAGGALFVARLTTDLFRPVPKQGLTVRTETVRAGNRLHVVQAGLFAGDVEVCRATALLLRTSDVPIPPAALPQRPAGPEGLPVSSMQAGRMPADTPRSAAGMPQGFHTTIEVKWVSRPNEDGKNFAWVRIPVPLVAGEELSPLVRVAATSDFGSAFSSMGNAGGAGWINADISLYLHRLPVGEWIGIEGSRTIEPHGIGVASTTLWDAEGPIGHTLHAQLGNQRRG